VNADERSLIAKILAGDRAAFGQLVERYQQRVYNTVYRVLHNAEDAADATQEVFLNVYQALGSFKGDSEFFTWLYRIAFNTAISHKRRRKPTRSIDGDGSQTISLEPADKSVDVAPDAAQERREDEQTLMNAIAQLSIEHRIILVLKDIEGRKYEEIAEISGIPVGTVRSRLHRARLELRMLLNPATNTEWDEDKAQAKPKHLRTT
jgi:RNA polymerase sigma-70 factor (ECF subfamily)